MLGESVADPHGVEEGGSVKGLGCLGIKTVMRGGKKTVQVEAQGMKKGGLPFETGPIKGYEIHMGQSFYTGGTRPLFDVTGRNGDAAMTCDGASGAGGRIWGTYIHGIFDNDQFRHGFIDHVAKTRGLSCSSSPAISFSERKEEGFKKLARHVRSHVDMDKIYSIAGLTRNVA